MLSYNQIYAGAIKREKKKSDLLLDAGKIDKILSGTLRTLSPATKKVRRSSQYPTKLDAVEAGIPSGHPMSGFGEELRERFTSALKDPQLKGLSSDQILQQLTGTMMMGEDIGGGVSRLEASHKAKLRADTSITNLFGLLGEDESVRGLPGYEEYKEEATKRPGVSHWMHPGESFAFGAGFSAAGMAVKKGLMAAGVKKILGRGLMMAPHPLAKIAGAGIMAIPMFGAWDAASNVIAKTDYGKAREGTWEKIGVDLLLGGVMGGAVVHKALTKGLSKAVEKELLSTEAIRVLRKDPTAAKAILAGETTREANKAAGRVNDILQEKVVPREVLEKLTDLDAYRVVDPLEQQLPGFRGWQSGETALREAEERAIRYDKLRGKTRKQVQRETESRLAKRETDKLIANLVASNTKTQVTFGKTLAEKVSAERLSAGRVNRVLDITKEKGISVKAAIEKEKQAHLVAQRVKEQERIKMLAKKKPISIPEPKVVAATKKVEETLEKAESVGANIKAAAEKGVETYNWKDGSTQKIVKMTKELYDSVLKGSGAPSWTSLRRNKYASLVKDPGSDVWYLDSYGSLYEVRPTGQKATSWSMEGKLTFGKTKVPGGQLTLEGVLAEGKKDKIFTGIAGKREAAIDLAIDELKEIASKGKKKVPSKLSGRKLTKEEINKLAGVEEVPAAGKVTNDTVLWEGHTEKITMGSILNKIKTGDKTLQGDLNVIRSTHGDFVDIMQPGKIGARLLKGGMKKGEVQKVLSVYEKQYDIALKKEGLKISGEVAEKEFEVLEKELYHSETVERLGLDAKKLQSAKSTSVSSEVLALDDRTTGLENVLDMLAQKYKADDLIPAKVAGEILGRSFKKSMKANTLKEKIETELTKAYKTIDELEGAVTSAETASFNKVTSRLTSTQKQMISDNEAVALRDFSIVDDAVMNTGALESQADAILAAATKGEVGGANKKLLAIIGLASVPLAGVLGLPEDADAGIVQAVARTTIPKHLVNQGEKASGGILSKGISYMNDFVEAGFVYTAAPEGSKIMAKAQNVLRTAPLFMKDVGGKGISNIIKTTKKVLPLMDKMAPYTVMDLVYKQGYSAAPEIGMVQNAIANVANGNLRTLGNILKDVPLLRKEKAMQIIMDEMKPLAEQFSGDVGAYRVAEMRMDKLVPKLKKTMKGLKKDGRKNRRVQAKIIKIEAEIAATEKALIETEPGFRAFEKAWEAKAKDLASRYSTSRIFFATEDTAEYTVYPWLKGMLSAEEKEAVSYIKLMNQEYAKRIEAAGMDTLKGPYVHHPFHPAWSDKAVDARLAEFGLESSGIPFSKFFRRSKYSKGLVPDIAYAQQKYILDAERRIQWSQFWGKGKEDSWYAHRNSAIVKNSPVLEKVWTQIEQSMVPPADTRLSRIMNRYSSFEVFRLLGGSASVAFKHVFKNIGTISSLGVGEFFSKVPDAMRMAIRNTRHSQEMQDLYRFLNIKGTGQKKFMDDAVRSIIFQSRGMNMVADLDFASPIINKPGFWGAFDRNLNKINQYGSIPVRIIESVDRHHTVLAALHAAEKKGMTSSQALHAVYSMILKNNFLSGSLNPEWMRNPAVRALFLFQNTGFKIMSRRLVTAYNAGKDVVNMGKVVGGRIKHKEIPLLLKEMTDLGSHMLKAENTMKQNMIYDALFKSNSRDVIGKSYMRQAMTEIILSGAVLGAGGAIGLNLMPQVWHIPFQRHGRTEPSLAVNPVLSAFFTNMHKREAAEEYGEDKEFFMSGFLKSFLGSTGYMNMTMWKMFRGIRGREDDIPDLYKDSWLRYFFSVPASEE